MGGVDAGEVTGRDGIADHAAGAGVIQAELIGDGRDGGFVGNPQPGRDCFDDLDVLDLAQVVVRGCRGVGQGLHRLSKWPAVDYGSGPENGWDREINHLAGGRGVYVRDPDGHSDELFTAVP